MKQYIQKSLLYSLFLSTLLSSHLMAVDVEQLEKDVDMLKANLESNSKSGFQIAGYASFDYAKDDFSGVKFAPIFHAKYGNIFQFEGELEFTVDSKGETTLDLEYAAGTIFINNYMGLQVGKFMSPIGQFVQNQHPSWINKLPATPLGFGHDGAAPTSNVGVALRGGLPKIAGLRNNYVLFISNAPVYGLADGDLGIDATGKTTSNNAQKTIGGRYAISPVPTMEIGISSAFGELADMNDTKIIRDYFVFDIDLMYNIDNLSIKAEYVQQDVGKNTASLLDTEGGSWKSGYLQASYQLTSVDFEPVLRYGDYHNPEVQRNQIALGLNYLFSNNLIAKIAYEINTDETTGALTTSVANEDIFRAQLAFGF